ncbi:MAG: O-antigen ligase family protein [Lachnospiraceae bacterium]
MSNKVNRRKDPTANAGTEIIGQLIEYTLAVVMIVVCLVVPLYAKEGYQQIGNAKFTAYKYILIVGFTILLVMAAIYFLFRIREKLKWSVSVTDMLVLAYLVFCGISVISGGFYEDALWGCNGWNMGLMSQLSFVLMYLFLSRFGRYYRFIVTVMCSVAAVVFFIGILHRMMLDPIGFYDGLENYQKAQFLSTLGQATWYASFQVVVLPVGIAFFLYAENKVCRVLSGIYVWIGFCSLVTQNSDSAYFALTGFMLVFFWLSVEKRESFCRFLWVCTLFFVAGKLMYYLLKIHPNPDLEYDVITNFILCSPCTWILLVIFAVACVTMYFREQKPYPVEMMMRLRKGVLITVGILFVGIVSCIVLQAKGLLPEWMSTGLERLSYLNWNDSWGNGRGRIWSFAVRMYGQESLLHKLFGIGPDCFNSYVTAYHSEEAQLLWGEKLLTNAHNEWLNILINTGLFGVAAYMGIFVSAACRFIKRASGNPMLAGATAAIVSYMAYNFFCYQQVLCTPFIFILIGIGEYVTKQLTNKISSSRIIINTTKRTM